MSGSSYGECLPLRWVSQVTLGLCSASLVLWCPVGWGEVGEHRGLSEGVSNVPAAARAWVLPAFLESASGLLSGVCL